MQDFTKLDVWQRVHSMTLDYVLRRSRLSVVGYRFSYVQF